MKHIGHPLFMDETYGGTEILRGQRSSSYKAFIQNCFKLCPSQALHAKTLGFVHPTTKQQMDFDSEWPEDFRQPSYVVVILLSTTYHCAQDRVCTLSLIKSATIFISSM